MKTFFKSLISLSLVTSLFFVGCNNTVSKNTSSDPLKRTELLMGTTVSVTLFRSSRPRNLANDAFNLVKELENELSLNKSSTLLTELNASSGTAPYKVNSTLFDIVEKGVYYSELTNGSFDLSVRTYRKTLEYRTP